MIWVLFTWYLDVFRYSKKCQDSILNYNTMAVGSFFSNSPRIFSLLGIITIKKITWRAGRSIGLFQVYKKISWYLFQLLHITIFVRFMLYRTNFRNLSRDMPILRKNCLYLVQFCTGAELFHLCSIVNFTFQSPVF